MTLRETAIKIDRLLKAGDIAGFNALVKGHDQLKEGFSAQCFGVQAELQRLGWTFTDGSLTVDGKGYYPPYRNASGELIAGYSFTAVSLEVPAYQWQGGYPTSHGTIIALKG